MTASDRLWRLWKLCIPEDAFQKREGFFAKFSLEHDALQEREYACAVFLLFETWSVFGCVMNQEKIYVYEKNRDMEV